MKLGWFPGVRASAETEDLFNTFDAANGLIKGDESKPMSYPRLMTCIIYVYYTVYTLYIFSEYV